MSSELQQRISSINLENDSDICQHCGACCASFRVSFYWAEGEALGIPETMTTKVNDFYTCMKGTDKKPVKCVALAGDVGQQVACQIYEQRSSTCQSVKIGDEQCLKARTLHGLSGDLISNF